jgi:hypothetical protein
MDQVEECYGQKIQIGHIDIYEKKKGKGGEQVSWLLSSIEPTSLRAVLDGRQTRPRRHP